MLIHMILYYIPEGSLNGFINSEGLWFNSNRTERNYRVRLPNSNWSIRCWRECNKHDQR